MTKLCFIFFALLVATVAMADNELLNKASQEVESPRVAKTVASDVGLNPDSISLLVLKDPTPEFKTRSYDWLLGVKVQSFQPSGELRGYNTVPYRLENISAFYLPSLELGLQFNLAPPKWKWGLITHAGYSSQNSLVSFSDQTLDPEARFTTLLTDVGFHLAFDPAPDSWGFQSDLGAGVINYSQTGSSAYSKVSRESNFEFFSAGLHASFPKSWQVLLSYVNRNLLNPQNSEIFLPTDSVELGTRLSW